MVARPPDRLAGSAVYLRRWRLDDIPMLVAAVEASREHLRPWMPWAQESAFENEKRFVETSITKFNSGEEFNYAILTPDDALVGGCGLHRRTASQDAFEIGYWVHQRHTRHGYATAAAEVLTEAALRLPGIHQVEIHCDELKTPSAGIPKKLGFRLHTRAQRPASAPAESSTELVWVLEPS